MLCVCDIFRKEVFVMAIKSQKELETYIEKRCSIYADDKSECKRISNNIKEKYNIPRTISLDILTLNKSTDGFSRFILYAIFQEVAGNLKEEDFFTKDEINYFSNYRYQEDKIKFPMCFHMKQVTVDQWIGIITTKELMKLRDAQLINYNTNTQRSMKAIGKGQHYQITLNKKALRDIGELYNKKSYIPTTITLNMPEDTDYIYNEERSKLIINNIKYFDIIDGYHRYIAMSNEYNSNANFDYPMELRIVAFPEYKAKQFIFQEDQKTKMTAVESKSFNQNDAGNIVAQRLNNDPECNFMGLISLNGVINSGELGLLVSQFWFKKKMSKGDERRRIIEVAKDLKYKLNYISECNPSLLTKCDSYCLACMMYMFSLNIQEDKYLEVLNELLDVAREYPKNYIISKIGISRKVLNSLAKVGENYVQ